MPDAAARRNFETLVAAAFSDGFLDESEKIVLARKAERLGIPPRDLQDLLVQGQKRQLSIAVPPFTPQREALLEDLIEVVAADGRVEAAEYSLLARFAQSMKISLPELRQRVSRRMQAGSGRDTGTQRRRESAPPSPSTGPGRVPPLPSPPARAAEPSPFQASPAGPAHQEFPKVMAVAGLPPVTLGLLKQSIMFENEADSLAAIGRTLGVPPESAAGVRREILEAFPELKPASMVIRNTPRR